MAGSPTDLPVQRFAARDGVGLAWRELGEEGARPVVLIHGYFSNATVNWIRYGHAAAIAARGFRVVVPDLRAHGDSDRPHDPAAYPPDVLAADGEELLVHLGVTDYDLVGYSLGARTALRMMVRGARPGRAVLCGMGLQGMLDTASRGEFFRRVLGNPGTFERGTSEWLTEAFLKTTGGDPQALLGVLDSFVDSSIAEIRALAVPVLVVAGTEDRDNGPAEELAEALPSARFQEVPGNHMNAVTRPELGQVIAGFLAEG